MTGPQIRESFLKYFEQKEHVRRPSSSLVPDNDPSVLLTSAGMQQFKPYFLAEKDPQKDFGVRRVTTVQKCFRTSDIDQVGDTTHLTFFEMLGNFSFGDYWKTEAIKMAWEYLTQELKLDPARISVSIFAGDANVPRDTEAETAWKKYVPKERILAFDRQDNFWGPPGKSGPCGPSTEIHYQIDPKAGGRPNGENFVEIWNLVFTEYFMNQMGELSSLPQKNIDTGMGVERLSMAVQKKLNIFETDAYQPILETIEKIEEFGAEEPENERRGRIIADHIRAAVFLLADGVQFSNKDQGYILRRIVRRAADQFAQTPTTLESIAKTVVTHFGQAYPEIKKEEDTIQKNLSTELAQYKKVLELDVRALVKKLRKGSGQSETEASPGPSRTLLTPDEAFTLFATHGISLDRLSRLGFEFERQAVEERVAKHQELSRAGAEKKFGGHGLSGDAFGSAQLSEPDRQTMTRLHTATHLLHAALRQVLGPEVKQMGSDITTERLRFDFSFHRKLSEEEKRTVELLMNEKIREDLPVTQQTLPYDQAIAAGALAFFKEKYPAEVSVYSIGNFSKELCGGPHVQRTSQVGEVKIVSEQSVGAGVRRVKAMTNQIL